MNFDHSASTHDSVALSPGKGQADAVVVAQERAVLVPIWLVLLLPAVIFVAQILLGTSLYFASASYLFNSISLIIPNILGGLRNLSALLALIFCVKLVLLSQILKIFLLQPADSNLYQPEISITIVVMAALAILTSSAAVRFLVRPRALFSSRESPRDLTRIALISLVLACGCFAVIYAGGGAEEKVGGLYGPVKIMLIPALNMMIIAATASAILLSDGQRSVNWLVVLVVGAAVFLGVLSFSKQKMLMPFLVYLITCWCFRYQIKSSTLLTMIFVTLFAVFIVSPVVNAYRDQSLPLEERHKLILETIDNILNDEHALREARSKTQTIDHLFIKKYYGESMGILDRFNMAHVDQVAEGIGIHGTIGFATLKHGLSMMLPRFLNPNKPTEGPATIIRYHIDRRAAISSSQYSYGIVGDGYASFGYLGVYMYTFVFMLVLFGLMNTLSAKLDYNIWAAFLFMEWHHQMLEATSGALLVGLTHGMLIIVLFYISMNAITAFANNRLFGGPVRLSHVRFSLERSKDRS